MKKIVTLLFVLIISSCQAQEKKLDIQGNWYMESNNSQKEFVYLEIYIDDTTFSFYDDLIGYKGGDNYTIDKKILYLMINEDKTKLGLIKVIDKNTISFNGEDGKIVIYKKVIGNGMKLDDLLFKNTQNQSRQHRAKLEDKYWEAFNKRKIEWEKGNG